ncbi:MAG: hypothetical protein R3D71_09015 [Rickettsiales bacterium]
MNWQEKINPTKFDGIKKAAISAVEYPAKFLNNGHHAFQSLPSQHRLSSAAGMALGWKTGDYLRDIMFGVNQFAEGEYEEVKRKDVPAPLRFLHKTIDWNPHSDAPDQQWKKLAHQMLPAVFAGVGTVIGSTFIFEKDGKEQAFIAAKKSKSPLTFMDAEKHAHYNQAKVMRVLTAATGGFSTASMLTIIYGAMLNMAFATANGARIFTGDLAKGNAAPAKSLDSMLGSVGEYTKLAEKSGGKVDERWAKGLVTRVLEPLFGEDLKSPEAQERVRGKIQEIFQKTFDKHKNQDGVINPEKLAEAVSADMKKIFGNHNDINEKNFAQGFDKAIEELGLNPKNAKFGNAIPLVRWINEALELVGIGKNNSAKSFSDRIVKERNTPTHHSTSPAGA